MAPSAAFPREPSDTTFSAAAGSSHGDGRIFRLAYQQEHYVDMMLHSLPLWQQLQDFAGEPLMATTGGINIACTREALAKLQSLYERRGFAHGEVVTLSDSD